MAVVETVKIEGDGSGLEDSIKGLNKEAGKLRDTIEEVGKTTKTAFDKAEKSVEGVQREVEKTNSSFKELANSAKSIALVSVALDAATEAFAANQAVVDIFNTALGAVQLTVSRIIDSFTKGTALNLGTVISDASEVVQLEKEAARAAAQRTAVQLEYQLLAEQARQVRDDEQKSIENRGQFTS
jgi:phage-related minor tail protein